MACVIERHKKITIFINRNLDAYREVLYSVRVPSCEVALIK